MTTQIAQVCYDCRRVWDMERRGYCIELCPLHQAAPKLLMALRICASFIGTWEDCLAGVQMSEDDFGEQSGLREARAAIAATGAQP